MQRRDFLLAGLATGTPGPAPASELTELQRGMAAGAPSAVALTRLCLERIATLDRAGPAINAIIELNPDALAIAAMLDAERAAGRIRGPLHGIPILLKDVIATADRMATSAGSLALDGIHAQRDAAIVSRLRDAGAVILAKTNLSEWSNLRSSASTAGWSARGGLTRNPFALDRVCGGSSSGSAAAVAAGLAPLAIGTETDGSIVCPASICGLVGIKPTVGLVSGAGILRITDAMDTAGPMARSVSDAALLLGVLAGHRDPAHYLGALGAGALAGKRIGVVRNHFVRDRATVRVITAQLAVLKRLGASLTGVDLPQQDSFGNSWGEVILTDFKANLARWLADYLPDAPIRSMTDLIAFNRAHGERELCHFGQELLEYSARMGAPGTASHRRALAHCLRLAREDGIDRALKRNKLDALVSTTSVPGWKISFGKRGRGDPGLTTPPAVAGYPHITVPAGQVDGLPVGLSFVGPAWSEPALLGMAYAYEQATLHRRAPRFRAAA